MSKTTHIINRELSWLSFNHRVLQESADKNVPLIERLRFLGIFSNNLDEFFRVRVATIKRMIDVQQGEQRVEGIRPKRLMAIIQKQVIQLQNLFETTFNTLLDELEEHHIYIINETELTETQQVFVRQYFKEKVRPVISPIMLHNIQGFPYLQDHSIYLAIKLTNSADVSQLEYALIEIPSGILPRFVQMPADKEGNYIILVEDIIRFSLKEVFSILHFDTFEAWTIKLTRDAELDVDNDVSQSFLEKISKSLLGRKTGQPVRFLFDASIAKDLLEFIIDRLGLDTDNNLIPGARYHNFKDFMAFPNIGPNSLVYSRAQPLGHPEVKDYTSILEVMRKKDLLLHMPYQDFNIFISLLQEASIDPNVKEISITIYRVARNSKVMNALVNACENGKKVNVVIELQARFDEETNIYWSRRLEEVGASIYFGFPNLKVHAKLVSIARRENNRTVYYSCVSTGNFHEGNSAVYSDLMLLTADKRITSEVKKLFEFFEHTYRNQSYKHLLVSPLYMRRRFYRFIDNEIANAKAGKDAYIILKINNLVDREIIEKLYEANNAGVKITLNVRGICSLKPGVPGKSEHIKAISIIDRFLEHARIMVFCNNRNPMYFISSADWMGRNFDRRIEVATPIYDKALQKEIDDLLEIQHNDNIKARVIDEEQQNSYVETHPSQHIRSQFALYDYYRNKLEE
ncbi:MAG: polyphosphate kinase 1 [Bacteroidota bacterium]|nr:MAG: polyphosphate kinase 1 [Bacteroidota bacterium]